MCFDLVRRLGGILALAILVCPLLGSSSRVREVRLTVSPNPAGSKTVFTVEVPRNERFSLGVYDVGGRKLKVTTRTIPAITISSGEPDVAAPTITHRFEWDLRDANGARVRPGVYFVRVNAPSGEKRARVAVVQ